MDNESYAGKIKESLWWWLGKRRPFILDDQFKIELLFIDKLNNSAKIKVTNLKTGEISQQPVDSFEASYGEE